MDVYLSLGWTNRSPTTNLAVPRYVINIFRVFLFTRSALKAVYVHKVFVPFRFQGLKDKDDAKVTFLVI